MKIMFVHNSYQQRGGEDSVVEAEIAMLRKRGHEVIEYRRQNDEIVGASKIGITLDTFWSRRTVDDIQKVINETHPDVVHSHNTFPLISPSLYWATSEAGIPLVQTLHNFRLLCPQAMFLRAGRVCEDCIGKVPWRGAVHACYRGSVAQSAVVAGMTTAHRLLGTWQDKVTRFIALNDFCRNKLIEGGLPSEKILVKPNFVDWNEGLKADIQKGKDSPFLFVGRLSVEKGISVLAQAVTLIGSDIELRVAGNGAEANQLTDINGIVSLGALSGDEVRAEMSHALALVMPSIWYETFGLVAIEAYACGLPVIASRLGAMMELVEDGKTGLLFDPGDPADLASKMLWAKANPSKMVEMGKNARRKYEAEFTEEINYKQLLAIYQEAIEQSNNEGAH